MVDDTNLILDDEENKVGNKVDDTNLVLDDEENKVLEEAP